MLHDLTDKIDDGRERKLDLDNIVRLIVHRIDFSNDSGAGYFDDVQPCLTEALTGEDLAARFMDDRRVLAQDRMRNDDGLDIEWRDRPGRWTGGEIPYHVLARHDGHLDQMLRISEFGPHARRWSWSGVALAVAGDFRAGNEPPPIAQWQACVRFTALWVSWLQRPVVECVFGHTELPDASKDSGKDCPGIVFDMDRLRWEAEGHPLAHLTKAQAEGQLLAMGVRF